MLLLLRVAGSACAAGGVYQIGVVRADGSRTAGSAVQLSPGLLVANCHTLRRAEQIVVLHPNRPFKARVDRTDPHHDLCLLRTARFSGHTLDRIGSDALRVGDAVSAYGFAPGFRMSIARGHITALHAYDGAHVIRTSARFPPGASGGALFDGAGHLIGVLTFRARDESLNYALPMQWLERLLAQEESAATSSGPAFWEDDGPGQPEFLQAAHLEHTKNWGRLRELALRWTQAPAQDAEAWRALGTSMVAMGEAAAALGPLDRAIALQPASAQAWYWIALAARAAALSDREQAARKRVLELDAPLAQLLDARLSSPTP